MGYAILFIVFGMIFLAGGYAFTRSSESSITVGSRFRRYVVTYSGGLARIHGIVYLLIGMFGILWGSARLLGILPLSFDWVLVGCILMQAFVFGTLALLSILRRVNLRSSHPASDDIAQRDD